jgi:hypothetical protein
VRSLPPSKLLTGPASPRRSVCAQAALGWYEAALARERQQPWAMPSALYCRWKLTGTEQHLQALLKLAQQSPPNERALQLAQLAYGGGLPEPSDAS